MKYETPEVVALPLAVNAIQSEKVQTKSFDHDRDITQAYEDWEE
jgi:hypothetical protein